MENATVGWDTLEPIVKKVENTWLLFTLFQKQEFFKNNNLQRRLQNKLRKQKFTFPSQTH